MKTEPNAHSIGHPLCVRCRLRGLLEALDEGPTVPVKPNIIIPVVRGVHS